jgi:hypothetical protein
VSYYDEKTPLFITGEGCAKLDWTKVYKSFIFKRVGKTRPKAEEIRTKYGKPEYPPG